MGCWRAMLAVAKLQNLRMFTYGERYIMGNQSLNVRCKCGTKITVPQGHKSLVKKNRHVNALVDAQVPNQMYCMLRWDCVSSPAFAEKRCLTCHGMLFCNHCYETRHSPERPTHQEALPVDGRSVWHMINTYCVIHQLPETVFCQKCRMSICPLCVGEDTHSRHPVKPLSAMTNSSDSESFQGKLQSVVNTEDFVLRDVQNSLQKFQNVEKLKELIKTEKSSLEALHKILMCLVNPMKYRERVKVSLPLESGVNPKPSVPARPIEISIRNIPPELLQSLPKTLPLDPGVPDIRLKLLHLSSKWSHPYGIAVLRSGEIVVSNFGNNVLSTVRRQNAETAEYDLGIGNLFNRPFGIALLSDDTLIISDQRNHCLRSYTQGEPVIVLAGRPGTAGFADGSGYKALFNFPMGICVFEDSIFVADMYNHRIRKVTRTGIVSTVAGSPLPGSKDGPYAEARFCEPTCICAGGSPGSFFVGQSGSVRKLEDNSVSTLALFDRKATSTLLAMPSFIPSLCYEPQTRTLVVSDRDNHQVWKLSLSERMKMTKQVGILPENTFRPGAVALHGTSLLITSVDSHSLLEFPNWNQP
ncbi:DNA-binding beta-propeller fold protein YncE [Pelomyxa schiedti]|nr:DNA-binding beta-propeller fold protein YncE [Pelomyxa schiedti]